MPMNLTPHTPPRLHLAILAIKLYIELFCGKMHGKRVNYDNFRHWTHALILLILIATVSFHVALWPHYGGAKTMLVLTIFGFGLLIPLSLLLPMYVQNGLAAVIMTFFLQQYQ
uniref:Uncharacterized protein n=1 Tax=Odontella aurita TaxID=265563 RepID=A0A7S4MDQ8_9STRA